MDPLVKVKEAHQKGIIPDEVYSLVKERFPITTAGNFLVMCNSKVLSLKTALGSNSLVSSAKTLSNNSYYL